MKKIAILIALLVCGCSARHTGEPLPDFSQSVPLNSEELIKEISR